MSTTPAYALLSVRYCARDFTLLELQEIRRIIAAPERPNRTAIARAACERFGWYKPDGGLKTMACSVALRRMEADGLLVLPPPQHRTAPAKTPVCTAISDPGPAPEGSRGDLGPLVLRQVPVRWTPVSRQLNEVP